LQYDPAIDDPRRRLDEAYAAVDALARRAMEVSDHAERAATDAQFARIATDAAARHSAEARRTARELKRMIVATLGILDADEGVAP